MTIMQINCAGQKTVLSAHNLPNIHSTIRLSL